MKRLAQCSCLGEAALSFYLWEAGTLDVSPAGIYRGALDLPLPLAPSPLHPESTRPSGRGVKEGYKGLFFFFLKRAIPWQFCSETSWRQHQPCHLLCPLLVAALEILSDALLFQKDTETPWPLQLMLLRLRGCLRPQRGSNQSKITQSGAEGRGWGCENANGPCEKLA